MSFTFTNDHNHPVLGDLFAEFDIDSETFCEEIANARTIGWLSELEALRARGLAPAPPQRWRSSFRKTSS